jgi:hypothetical protein
MIFTPEELSKIYQKDDFISSDKFLAASRKEDFNFIKRDFICRPGRYRGTVVYPIWTNPFKYVNKPIVVGASDFSTGFNEIAFLKRFKVRAIFGTNTLNIKNISESIPLGLTNNTRESIAHEVFGDTNHLNIANSLSAIREEFDASIYVNFSVENNSRIRKNLIKILKNLKGVTYDEFSISSKSRISYLNNLRKFSLVPCPEGNGIDTHRLWETLYMGGTPIIIRNNFLPSALDFLPVIQLNSWDEISNIDLLESTWNSFREKLYDFTCLTSSFWISRVGGTNRNMVPQ